MIEWIAADDDGIPFSQVERETECSEFHRRRR